MLEKDFQAKLIKELERMFPGSIVTKVETYLNGFPDLLILYQDRWALLECKRSEEDMRKSLERQPNQRYYVEYTNDMSFARYIFPENKEEVLYELRQAFGAEG